jgi:hypothetical protein
MTRLVQEKVQEKGARKADLYDRAHRAKVDIGRRSIHMTEQRKLLFAIGVSRNATP